MTEDERRRWRAGRYDWRDSQWQDHCGDPACTQCEGSPDCRGYPVIADMRARFEASILGAEVDRL